MTNPNAAPGNADTAFLAPALICPSCGSTIRSESTEKLNYAADYYGIAECECGQYPVIAGIPLIFDGSIPDSSTNTSQLLSLLKEGRNEDALLAAVAPAELGKPQTGSKLSKLLPKTLFNRQELRRTKALKRAWNEKFVELSANVKQGSMRELISHYFSNYGDVGMRAGNYFLYKFAQPKHLVSLSIMSLAHPDKGPSLDLGCGIGNMVRYLAHRSGGQTTIGTDVNFFLLWLAKTRVAKTSQFVCCDAAAGLPFETDTIGTILLSNWLHTLYAKRVCAADIERVASDEALIAFTSVRHRDYKVETPNRALSCTAYGSLLERTQVAVPEAGVLERYLQGKGPDLSANLTADELAEQPLIDLVASNRADVLATQDGFDDLPHTLGRLDINPLYRTTKTEEGMTLDLHWPSTHFVEDNSGIDDYLPTQVRLSAQAVVALESNQLTEETKSHARLGVIIDVPDCY